jgi:hypothetical protein
VVEVFQRRLKCVCVCLDPELSPKEKPGTWATQKWAGVGEVSGRPAQHEPCPLATESQVA